MELMGIRLQSSEPVLARARQLLAQIRCRCSMIVKISVAEPHHFYAAPAPGKNFDAARLLPYYIARQNC
jgi:hypothetical protein